jgi:UDP-N-acetylmuramyl pentapeptide synthase
MRIALNHPELFATVFESITKSKLHRPVTGLSTDSREVKEGDLYIAINGERVNGHQFLNEVGLAGAVAALVCDINEHIDIQQIKVSDTLSVISEIANKWRMKFDIPVIGITGSNGKTSTKELLSHVLSSEFKMHATKGNFNTKIGIPLTLLEMEQSHDISI